MNLTIGVITTGFALGLLAYMIFDESTSPDTFAAALSHYVPRVTTVTFIEVFSFFFLRLYRTSLEEIRFYQNELTSLAGHQIALETSRQTSDPACLRQVLDRIVRHNPNASIESTLAKLDSKDDARPDGLVAVVKQIATLAAGVKTK
ncbi:MAG: hypothetical protein HY897_10535 [Deltaproteobacteria bacterium]|nr:hypothetical protein [Deltaproteobacteria bacterium]